MTQTTAVDTWNAVLGDLQLHVTRPIYETWLRDTEGLSLADNTLTVAVSTPFAIEWLERRMYQIIQRTTQRVTDRPLEVQFRVATPVSNHWDDESFPTADQSPPPRSFQSPQGILNGKYTFRSFVVGPSNRLPYSAAQAVSEYPGQTYNPLFIYSGVGLGKTHLLHAIGHSCALRKMSLMYVTSEQFTNDFILALRNRNTEEFRARYRSVDMLLIDDIQFLGGKEQTQEVFFHTFNDLHTSNKQVVLTSDRPIKALSLLEDRLRSRFEWGLIVDIQAPDLETRVAILRNKAEQMHVVIDDAIIEHVAKKVQKNVRELEGSLNRIVALSKLTDGPLTLEVASQAIDDINRDASRRSISPDEILDEVTRRFQVYKEELVGTSRKKGIVRARHIAVYLMHEELGMKHTDIGRLMGGRDHSTIINAVGKVNFQINVDSHLRQDVLAIKEDIFN